MQRSVWILGVAGWLVAAATSAQELGLSEMYGRGVHAYFSGQSRAAFGYLSAVINAGTRDPRAFYFRGLAFQRLGRPSEAQADFRHGATLEHQDVGEVFGVDRSLERVQGYERLGIERHRAAARLGAAEEVVMERNRRTLAARAASPEVAAPGEQILSEQAPDLNNLPAPGAAPPVKAEVERPFTDPTEPNAPAASPPPLKPARPNPLNEAPAAAPPMPAAPPPAPKPAGNDPFGNPAAPAANAAANPPAEEGNGSGKALGNAFKRAFGGFMPSLPEVPAVPGLGGGEKPQNPAPQDNNAPAVPPAAKPASDDPFATPPAASAKPAPAKNENPFANP